jgi:hypothetical protein
MKTKLIKNYSGFDYFLADENGSAIATSDNGKLSKQNCDEIFGVVDVEKLADEFAKTKSSHSQWLNTHKRDFKEGFNKAMELNKDKVFTLEDMGNLWDFCVYNKGTFAEFIQQPTEIEVEIEMEYYDPLPPTRYTALRPKLDADGCLILKKIE